MSLGMKRLILAIIGIIATTFSAFGQAPENFNYQAVIRDTENKVLDNKTINILKSIFCYFSIECFNLIVIKASFRNFPSTIRSYF